MNGHFHSKVGGESRLVLSFRNDPILSLSRNSNGSGKNFHLSYFDGFPNWDKGNVRSWSPPSLLISSRYLHSRWWTVWADWRRWRPSSRRWCQRLRALSGSLWNTTVRTDWGKANKMNIYLKVAFSSKLLFFNIQMEAKNGTLKNNEYKFSPNTFDGSSLYGFP